MKTKTILLIIIAVASVSVACMCWGRKKEWLSGLGYNAGALGTGYGPIYEGYTPNVEKESVKEGFCGACS
jgi:hypothetical protein